MDPMLSDDLSWFLVLATTEHMGMAAQELAIPQSTLSRKLSRLEKALHTTVFDRRGRSLVLNVRGKVLYKRLRGAVTQLDLAESEVRRLLDPETGLVRFDFLHSLGAWLAPQLIRAFTAVYPRADIDLHQGIGNDLVQRVLDEECDIALSAPQPDHTDLSWMEVKRQSLGLCVAKDHHCAGRGSVMLRDAIDDPFIATPKKFHSRHLLEELAEDEGIQPHVAFESGELSTVAGLVAAGIGVAVLPMGDPYLSLPGVTFIPLRTQRSRQIGLIWRTMQNPLSTPGLFCEVVRSFLQKHAL